MRSSLAELGKWSGADMRENLDTGFILLWLHALRELLLSLRRHLLVAQAGCLLSICCSVAVSLRCRLASVQEYNISFNRIYRATSLHGVSPFETFFVVELPNEPLDIDQPTRCPATEGCIMEVEAYFHTWNWTFTFAGSESGLNLEHFTFLWRVVC